MPSIGDPLHLSWVMAWDAHAILHQPLRLFDSNTFHPYPRSLTFGDHLLPEALLVAPVQWISGNAILAFNLASLLALTLSGLFMYVLVRHATGSLAAGFVAGICYEMSSFSQAELHRVHNLHVQWWPLALLLLVRFVESPSRRLAWLLVATLLAQGLSGTYYLIYTLLLLPVWALIAYWNARRAPTTPELCWLLAPAAFALALVLLIARPYLLTFRAMGFEKPLVGGLDLLAYINPHPENLVWGGLSAAALGTTGSEFVGLVAMLILLVGVAGLWSRQGRRSALALGVAGLLTSLLGLVFSTGAELRIAGDVVAPGPYALLYRMPLLRGMAGAERFSVLVVLGTSMLCGLGVATLERVLDRRRFVAVVALLAVSIPLERYVPRSGSWEVPSGSNVPKVYGWLSRQPRAATVDLPAFTERHKQLWSLYPYLSTYHWQPIPIGRTSFYPPIHDYLAWQLRGFPETPALALLAELDVRRIVVHPLMWPAETRAQQLARLETSPWLRRVQAFDDDALPERFALLRLGRERVYELTYPTPVSVECRGEQEIERSGWRLRASGDADLGALLDGDRGTAWTSGIDQHRGDFVQIAFPRDELVGAVQLELSYPYDEFPRGPLVYGRRAAGTWERLPLDRTVESEVQAVRSLLETPRAARLLLSFRPRVLERIRVEVAAPDLGIWSPPWTLPELRLFRGVVCHEGAVDPSATAPTVR